MSKVSKMSNTYSLSGSTPRTKLGSSILSQSSTNFPGSHSKFRGKRKKIATATITKRGQYRVIDSNNVDRTPKLLYSSDYQVIEEWQPTALDYVDADIVSTGSQISLQKSSHPSTIFFGGGRHPNSVSMQMSFSNIHAPDTYKEHTKLTAEPDMSSEVKSDDLVSEKAPSQFQLRDLPSREFFPPHSKVAIFVKETNSFMLFSLGSVVISATADNIEQIKERNQRYEFLTIGDGKFTRKLNTTEQQTVESISTSESCLIPKKSTANGSTWVTAWKIYDEYSGVHTEKKDLSIPIEDQWMQLTEDEKFFAQGLVMERIIGCPTYREAQLNYKDFNSLDPLSLDVQFTYSTETLWIYETSFVQKKPVTAIAINPLFPDIIAVGHGKFLYTETDRGFICIWSVKNPKHPERFYRFNSSVLCLDFSDWRPNHLAAGFLDGQYKILDISSVEKKVMYEKDSIACDTYESVIYTKWWVCKDIFDKEEERTMITTGDGRIIQFSIKMDKLVPFQMMRITKLEGRVKGVECLRTCEVEEIPMIRFPAARCVVRYPNDTHFYLVAGDDGSVHKCSTNFFTQHVDSFLAHSGPVYALKFSPVCNKIFLTCGADGAIRLWLWDLFEPLITLTVGPNPVEDAAWSPKNSTIIVSVSESNFYIWDLRRKAHHPASILVHPKNVKFSSLQFTKDGDNIMLGDVEGSIHIMALKGMPFEEKFKEEILASSILKELIVKPKLLKMVKKSGLAYREALFA